MPARAAPSLGKQSKSTNFMRRCSLAATSQWTSYPGIARLREGGLPRVLAKFTGRLVLKRGPLCKEDVFVWLPPLEKAMQEKTPPPLFQALSVLYQGRSQRRVEGLDPQQRPRSPQEADLLLRWSMGLQLSPPLLSPSESHGRRAVSSGLSSS